MTTENHHGQPKNDDSSIVTFAGVSTNSIPDGITEIEYESALEATQSERVRQALEAEWEADPDWRAFRKLCYSDTGTPNVAAIRKGVNHLITAAQNGHALAQCRLATELHLGEGRLGIKPNIHKAAAWYRAAAKKGDPIALQSLVVLKASHPDTMMQEIDAY